MPAPLALLGGTVSTASRSVGHAWSHYVGPGVEPPDPTPFEVVHDEPHAVLRRYSDAGADGHPILLVPPLAVHASCFDLRAGQSLVAHLAAGGRPVYLVDFGEMGFADRRMGFEDWVDRIVPDTLNRVADRHGRRGVDVVTWSLGGTITLLTAAAHDDLPLRSIAAVGTPMTTPPCPTWPRCARSAGSPAAGCCRPRSGPPAGCRRGPCAAASASPRCSVS